MDGKYLAYQIDEVIEETRKCIIDLCANHRDHLPQTIEAYMKLIEYRINNFSKY